MPANWNNFEPYLPEPQAFTAPGAMPDDDVQWADYAKSVMGGGASIVQSVGWLTRTLGAEDVGTSIETLGSDAVDFWHDSLSDPAKREISKQVVRKNDQDEYEWGDASLSTIGLMGAQSLLGTAAGMGAGAGLTKVLQVFANPFGRAALQTAAKAGSTQAAGKLKLVDTVLGATGFGAGEGGIGGISAGASVYDNIMSLPIEKMMANDRYRQVFESTDDTMSELERHQYAADTVAKEASSAAGWQSGLTTALLGAPMGAYFGRILGGAKLSATLPRGIATGAAGEAAQEFSQSGVEQYISNVETGKFDPDLDPFEGVVNAAVSGALAGALLGGGFGVAGVGPARAELQSEDATKRKEEIENVRKIGKPIQSAARQAAAAGVDPVPLQNIVAEWVGGKLSMSEALDYINRLENEATTGEPAVATKPPPPGPDRVLPETAPEAAGAAPAEDVETPAKTAVAPEIEEAAQQELLPEEAKPGDLETVNLLDMNVDAQTFQFKAQTDAQGVSKALQGVKKFDKMQAGVAIVYEDMNGDRFIVDGHQRVNLAKKLASEGQPREDMEIPAYVLKASAGVTPEAATLAAAIKNIGEQTGSPIDAAKVMRQIGTEGEAEMPTLPPNAALVKQAKGLRNLDEDAFAKAVNEVVPDRQASIVGEMIPTDGELQNAAIEVLRQTEPANDTQARAIVSQVRMAGVETQVTEDLFGEQQVAESLYLERAKVLDSALRMARRDKATFRTLTKREGVIAGTGENVLDTEANRAKMTEAELAVATLSTVANQKGPISDALTEAARQVKSGKKPGAVAQGFLEAAVAQIQAGDQARGESREVGQASEGTARQVEPDAAVTTEAPTAETLFSRKAERDPQGHCFENTGRYMLNNPGTDTILVHGTMMGQGPIEGIRFAHSWLERTEEHEVNGQTMQVRIAIDMTTDERVDEPLELPADLYENIGQAEVHARYTADEVLSKLAEHQHWGPWDFEETAEAAQRQQDLQDEIARRDRKRNTGQMDLFSRRKPLADITVSREFELEETGETVEVELNAATTLRQLSKRRNVVQQLRECVRA